MISGRYANHVDGRAIEVPGKAGEVHIQPVGPYIPRGQVDYPAVFEAALRKTLSMVLPRVRAVVVTYDSPEFGFEPRSCVHRLFRSSEPVCSIPRASVDARQRGYRQVLDRVLADYPTVIAFDPLPTFCDADNCHFEKDGRMMYRDSHHLGVLGGVEFARAMVRALPADLRPAGAESP